jgi:hypothetical protein
METAYQPELWRDLYVMLGTSSAALIGLLFVVTSLHLDEIVNNLVYRTRARSNSLYLIITLVEAALILTPQPMATLGLELTAINLIGLLLNARNLYLYFYKNYRVGNRGGMRVYRASTFTLGFLLGIAGGAFLIQGSNLGMYFVTASYVLLLVGVALNAWSIMLGVGEAETPEKINRSRVRKTRV